MKISVNLHTWLPLYMALMADHFPLCFTLRLQWVGLQDPRLSNNVLETHIAGQYCSWKLQRPSRLGYKPRESVCCSEE